MLPYICLNIYIYIYIIYVQYVHIWKHYRYYMTEELSQIWLVFLSGPLYLYISDLLQKEEKKEK